MSIGLVWAEGSWADDSWLTGSWSSTLIVVDGGMTYKEIQDQIMARLNLTSTDARTRIKYLINDRYRAVASSPNLARARYGKVNFPVTSGNPLSTQTNLAKLLTLYDPVYLKRPLREVALPQIREMDAAEITEGIPYCYAIEKQTNIDITVHLYPKPTNTYNLEADVLLAFTPLVNDTDIPQFPADFHDLLVDAVMADELLKLEKATPLATISRQRYEDRLSQLRYFVIKSAWLKTVPTDMGGYIGEAGRVWPYANLV